MWKNGRGRNGDCSTPILMLSMALGNGSRVVALPSDGDTIRGFSSPALIIEDEGSYVSDGLDLGSGAGMPAKDRITNTQKRFLRF